MVRSEMLRRRAALKGRGVETARPNLEWRSTVNQRPSGISSYGGFDWGKWLTVAAFVVGILIVVIDLAYSIGRST